MEGKRIVITVMCYVLNRNICYHFFSGSIYLLLLQKTENNTINRLCSALDCQLFLRWGHQSVFPFAIEGVPDTVKCYEVGISEHHSWNNTQKTEDCSVNNNLMKNRNHNTVVTSPELGDW